MIISEFNEYDLIVTQDEFIWVVHGSCGNNLVCRLKYIPDDISGKCFIRGKTYRRLFSPLFKKSAKNLVDIEKYPSIDTTDTVVQGLFLLNESQIIEHYSTKSWNRTNDTITSLAAHNFIKDIINESHIPQDMIGITGSLLLSSEVDGYSDIDIVIYGENNYFKFESLVSNRKLTNLYYRTRKEWEEFYDKYSISSNTKKEDFCSLMETNLYQGFYNKIPFSIFVGRLHLREYSIISAANFIDIEGIVIDNTHSHNFPCEYCINNNNRYYKLQSWCRLDRDRFRFGDRLNIHGIECNNEIVVTPNLTKIKNVDKT